MGSILTTLLIIGSIFTFLFAMKLIRKSTVRIEDTLFWIIFCLILILLSVFPKSLYNIAYALGFQSPINLVYLVIIFVLIVNQFLMTLKISRLTIKQKELVQALAITAKEADDKENKAEE
ncbi:MAG: DUF2304 domain-containing protein [Oscillospiraceae bacterium]|nr:DUF2304 domain-containing protein [Oscillospiraceae bacterium]